MFYFLKTKITQAFILFNSSVLNTVTKNLQSVVNAASSTATGALETVKSEVNNFITSVAAQGDELIEQISDAANFNLDEDVASCVNVRNYKIVLEHHLLNKLVV